MQCRCCLLNHGEKQAIQLARNIGYNTVLLDDLVAREAAQQLGLNVKGILGVITAAYRQNYLTRAELDIVFEAVLVLAKIFGLAAHLPAVCGPNSCILPKNSFFMLLLSAV